MKFSITQEALEEALTIVNKGMVFTSNMPILSGVYLKAESGTLELQTTDLNISIKHKVAANVEEDGQSVVSGKMLQNIVKTLPSAAVFFESLDHGISISCEKSYFRLNTLDPADFPDFPQVAYEQSIELPTATLAAMVSKVYKVASKDNSRPILQGIQLTVENNTVRLVATDSYRLAVCDTHVQTENLSEAYTLIVSSNVFHEVLGLPALSDKILIGQTDNQIVFISANTTFVSRKIEGNFPDYHQILPSQSNTTLKISTNEFVSALKRVSVMATSNPSVKFHVSVDEATLTLSAAAADQGESHEAIPVEAQGSDTTIALNYRYVFDCVGAVDGQEINLELDNEMRPGVFKIYGDINYLYLLMPVRI